MDTQNAFTYPGFVGESDGPDGGEIVGVHFVPLVLPGDEVEVSEHLGHCGQSDGVQVLAEEATHLGPVVVGLGQLQHQLKAEHGRRQVDEEALQGRANLVLLVLVARQHHLVRVQLQRLQQRCHLGRLSALPVDALGADA